MINALYRPLLAAFCLLFALIMVGTPALGQKFLPPEITEAQTITPEMNEKILMIVEPVMFDLGRKEPKPEDITDARKQLQQLFRASQPSRAYLEALSKAITPGMEPVVNHESVVMRMNAMIILTLMVDEGSKPLIDKGLADESDAVKHWAMKALGRRMFWWKAEIAAGNGRGMQTKIDDAIGQIASMINQDQPPHPIVVGSGLDALLKVNTPRSREALIDILNKRVVLHAADPDLSYAPERAAIEDFTNMMVSEVPVDFRSVKGLSRAMARYSALIIEQSQDNEISEEQQLDAHSMLFHSLQGMASVSVASKAPNAPPAAHANVKGWIPNGRWGELKGLLEKEWGAIYAAEPFSFKPAELAVKP